MGPLSETSAAQLARDLAPRVLGVLVHRHGDFANCEDAVQEALLAAAAQWPATGPPANPTGWLVTTASRRLIETWRSDSARKRREAGYAVTMPPGPVSAMDDTLTLYFLCCHPSLPASSQVTLTLRALGGLTTAEIARALLVPEATVAQRISRAKARIRDAGATFRPLTLAERQERLPAVLHVLYLVFNEGYTASSGPRLHRGELTDEAIRLARQLHGQLPDDGEVAGLLSLMLLTDARRPARTRPDGALVPLAEQDRSRWNSDAIKEGIALVTATLPRATPGPYQVQAAIAAVHDEAPTASDTDWPQILALYDVLAAVAAGPMVTLNRIVALAMVEGPAAGLAELDAGQADLGLAKHYRASAVRAHLLDDLGRPEEAREHYLEAARRTLSQPERAYLIGKARR